MIQIERSIEWYALYAIAASAAFLSKNKSTANEFDPFECLNTMTVSFEDSPTSADETGRVLIRRGDEFVAVRRFQDEAEWHLTVEASSEGFVTEAGDFAVVISEEIVEWMTLRL